MKFIDDFRFKKQFGQNFIFDKNYIESIVKNFNLNNNSEILEIGAGAGVLTQVLSENFKKVISFEIDNTLINYLQNLQQKYSNLNFVFEDVLNVKTIDIDNMFNEQYFLIANLPYYITSQIIFKFLFESEKINTMFVMVQKEVGERFCAKPSTRAYGIPTVLINTFGSCEIIKNVPKTVFTPIPNVDSCIICMKINKEKFNLQNKSNYVNFINNCFKMKRKTLYNNLVSAGYKKEDILNNFKRINLQEQIRPENLLANEYVNLYNLLK